MPLPTTKLVLLPGLDGTGNLFANFMSFLPKEIAAVCVRYPSDTDLDYNQLLSVVRTVTSDPVPFVLLAESFSTPLAIQFAATNPPNLRGLILCSGFATSPLRGVQRRIVFRAAPMLMRLPLPDFLIRFLLVGHNASPALLHKVRSTIASVTSQVLANRLRQVLACDASKELAGINVPLLNLRGSEDRLISKWCAMQIQLAKTDASYKELSGPHLLLQRFPQEAADIITSFIHGLT
jgi:pimeloyl-[acyl-carrier protein] methyl ester esterase